MTKTHTFRFVDDDLNEKLIDRLEKQARGRYRIDRDRTVRYSHDDEDLIGNTIICEARGTVFDSWQIISFPKEWADTYRGYMLRHDVPFQGEIRDDCLQFLLPRKYRPHNWKLENPAEVGRERKAV